jgi:hypothetical protein
MVAVSKRDCSHPVRATALDRDLVCVVRRNLPKGVVTIDHELPAVIGHNGNRRTRVYEACAKFFHIGRNTDHAVGVDPAEVSLDEVTRSGHGVGIWHAKLSKNAGNPDA